MKIAIAQLNYQVGNVAFNTQKIIKTIQDSKSDEAEMLVFSGLAVCGAHPQDQLVASQFLKNCQLALADIARHCIGIDVVLGCPVIENSQVFNAVILIRDQAVSVLARKKISVANQFDAPYFHSGEGFGTFSIGDNSFILCFEDTDVLDGLSIAANSTIIQLINPVFELGKKAERKAQLSTLASKWTSSVISVSQVGAYTDLIYEGSSLLLDSRGEVKAQLASFSEDVQLVDLSQLNTLPNAAVEPNEGIASIHQALILGIRDFFAKLGFQKVVLGLSGGIDSAVVGALACEALGADRVLGVLMPSKFSSDHSVADAVQLAQNLGCQYELVPIKESAAAFESMLAPAFDGLAFDLTEENIQARCRAVVLMAMANKFGRILLNTSNKSEGAVGYGTLYGDLCGALSPLGDLYKTQVYQLAHYINRNQEIIPQNTILKAPSAELRPGQKDSDSLPDYDVLDRILYQVIELKQDISAVIAQGFDAQLVNRVVKMLHQAQFKRHQVAPILKISTRSFGSDWHYPIVSKVE